MLTQILIGLAVLVILFVGIVASRPSSFRISRSKSMSAPASAPFALVNDHHNWGAWSPWEKLDPNMQKTYEGASSGVGAVYRWSGNSKAGEGINTIVESRPNELIRMKLEFHRRKPFQKHPVALQISCDRQHDANGCTPDLFFACARINESTSSEA